MNPSSIQKLAFEHAIQRFGLDKSAMTPQELARLTGSAVAPGAAAKVTDVASKVKGTLGKLLATPQTLHQLPTLRSPIAGFHR